MMLPFYDVSRIAVPPSFEKAVADNWMTTYERAVVVTLLRQVNARVVIEIGVQEGHLACEILRRMTGVKRYIGIDLKPGSQYVCAIASQQRERPGDRVGCAAKSSDVFQLMLRERGSQDIRVGGLPPCDACIIDGDHSLPAVRHDTALATAAVRKGGVIIWHDYGFWSGCGVPDALHELEGRALGRIEHTALAVEFR